MMTLRYESDPDYIKEQEEIKETREHNAGLIEYFKTLADAAIENAKGSYEQEFRLGQLYYADHCKTRDALNREQRNIIKEASAQYHKAEGNSFEQSAVLAQVIECFAIDHGNDFKLTDEGFIDSLLDRMSEDRCKFNEQGIYHLEDGKVARVYTDNSLYAIMEAFEMLKLLNMSKGNMQGVSDGSAKPNPTPPPEVFTNTKQSKCPQRTIDIEKLRNYFNDTFHGKVPDKDKDGYEKPRINLFDILIEDLQSFFTPIEIGQIALMCYQGRFFIKIPQRLKFRPWYKIFCKCIDAEVKSYDKHRFSNPKPELRHKFAYL